MTTIRDSIQQQLLARLQTLTDFIAERRNNGANDANHRKLALMLGGDETVLAADTMLVQKEMTVEVMVQVLAEDAPESLGRNAERYLDEQMGRVEAALFTPANLPGDIDVQPNGWSILNDPGSNLLRAICKLTIVYRHNIGDPSTFNPLWTE